MDNIAAVTTAKTLAKRTQHPHVVYRRASTKEYFVMACSNAAMAKVGVEKHLPEDCEPIGFAYPSGTLLSCNQRRTPVE